MGDPQGGTAAAGTPVIDEKALHELLKWTMLRWASQASPIVTKLPPSKPILSAKAVKDQQIWSFDVDFSAQGLQVDWLTVYREKIGVSFADWGRSDAPKSCCEVRQPAGKAPRLSKGDCVVCQKIEYCGVQVEVDGSFHDLPLTRDYYLAHYLAHVGQVEHANKSLKGNHPLWRLPADIDNSFQMVFGYQFEDGRFKPLKPCLETARAAGMQPGQKLQPYTLGDFGVIKEAGGFRFNPDTCAPDGLFQPTGEGKDRQLQLPKRVIVCASLVTNKPRPDFEPFDALTSARFYPHLMTITNFLRFDQKLEDLASDVKGRITMLRPEKSTMVMEGMTDTFATGLYTDANSLGSSWMNFYKESAPGVSADSLPIPPIVAWDRMFDFYDLEPEATTYRVVKRWKMADANIELSGIREIIPLQDSEQLVKAAIFALFRVPTTAATAETVGSLSSGAAALSYHVGAEDLPFPTVNLYKPSVVTIMPGQGEFDNIHIAPQYDMPFLLEDYFLFQQRAQGKTPKAEMINMAPVCHCDCFHFHWRWSRAFGEYFKKSDDDGKMIQGLQVMGWSAGGEEWTDGYGRTSYDPQPLWMSGTPLVHPNQVVDLTLIGSRKQGLHWDTWVEAAKPRQWQVMLHQGAAVSMWLDFNRSTVREAILPNFLPPTVHKFFKESIAGEIVDNSYKNVTKLLVRLLEVRVGGPEFWAYIHHSFRYTMFTQQERVRILGGEEGLLKLRKPDTHGVLLLDKASLKPGTGVGWSDCYVKVSVDTHIWQSGVAANSAAPYWGQVTTLPARVGAQYKFEVWEDDVLLSDTRMGSGRFTLQEGVTDYTVQPDRGSITSVSFKFFPSIAKAPPEEVGRKPEQFLVLASARIQPTYTSSWYRPALTVDPTAPGIPVSVPLPFISGLVKITTHRTSSWDHHTARAYQAPDAIVEIYEDGKAVFQSKVAHDTHYPAWYLPTGIEVVAGKRLTIRLYDIDYAVVGEVRGELIGETTYTLPKDPGSLIVIPAFGAVDELVFSCNAVYGSSRFIPRLRPEMRLEDRRGTSLFVYFAGPHIPGPTVLPEYYYPEPADAAQARRDQFFFWQLRCTPAPSHPGDPSKWIGVRVVRSFVQDVNSGAWREQGCKLALKDLSDAQPEAELVEHFGNQKDIADWSEKNYQDQVRRLVPWWLFHIPAPLLSVPRVRQIHWLEAPKALVAGDMLGYRVELEDCNEELRARIDVNLMAGDPRSVEAPVSLTSLGTALEGQIKLPATSARHVWLEVAFCFCPGCNKTPAADCANRQKYTAIPLAVKRFARLRLLAGAAPATGSLDWMEDARLGQWPPLELRAQGLNGEGQVVLEDFELRWTLEVDGASVSRDAAKLSIPSTWPVVGSQPVVGQKLRVRAVSDGDTTELSITVKPRYTRLGLFVAGKPLSGKLPLAADGKLLTFEVRALSESGEAHAPGEGSLCAWSLTGLQNATPGTGTGKEYLLTCRGGTRGQLTVKYTGPSRAQHLQAAVELEVLPAYAQIKLQCQYPGKDVFVDVADQRGQESGIQMVVKAPATLAFRLQGKKKMGSGWENPSFSPRWALVDASEATLKAGLYQVVTIGKQGRATLVAQLGNLKAQVHIEGS